MVWIKAARNSDPSRLGPPGPLPLPRPEGEHTQRTARFGLRIRRSQVRVLPSAPGLLRQELRRLLGRHRPREVKSLGHVATHFREQFSLICALYTFCYDIHP